MTCRGWLGVNDPDAHQGESSDHLLFTPEEHNSNLDDVQEPLLRAAQDEEPHTTLPSSHFPHAL